MAANQPAFGQEVGAGLASEELPAYAPMLAAYHRACARELRQIIADLPLRSGDRVLDLACGDGTYSLWLAERVAPTGSVIGVDIAPAYLDVARRQAAASRYGQFVRFQIGDVRGLPFADDEFDLVWCAHSLYSLPDPLAALREMRRVTRPGGVVAVLENDTLHHLLLPWPPDLELAVRAAQLRALDQAAAPTARFYIGRFLCHAFGAAGLERCRIATYTIERHAPLSADEQLFLLHYLRDLRERAAEHLDATQLQRLDRLRDPAAEESLLADPHLFLAHLEIVALGRKPQAAAAAQA